MFKIEELKRAAEGLKNKKAPGLDQIPNEVVKIVVKEIPDVVLTVLNKCLVQGKFPKEWKKAKLVLIPKPSKHETSIKYRPLSLLSTMGKLYERLIENRLRIEIEDKGGMSDTQFGFRKQRSTIDALQKVMDIVEKAKKGSYGSKNLCVMIVFDVKNAFNTARWNKIVEALEKLKVSRYLINIIKNYLQDRIIIVGDENKEIETKVGVPQGSVLGPLLWNVFL